MQEILIGLHGKRHTWDETRPFIILLGVMRMGAVTRPAVAGAIAGALSGALGAGAYALACTNDAGLFVALWYSLAVIVMAALGSAIGHWALAW